MVEQPKTKSIQRWIKQRILLDLQTVDCRLIRGRFRMIERVDDDQFDAVKSELHKISWEDHLDGTRAINERSIPVEPYKEDTLDKEAGETRAEEQDEGTDREDNKINTSDKISKGVDEGQKERRRVRRVRKVRIVERKKKVQVKDKKGCRVNKQESASTITMGDIELGHGHYQEDRPSKAIDGADEVVDYPWRVWVWVMAVEE
ncbi:hypothetical protein BY996DRAFT_6506938 [Phakopsora pachyrhizi]|nr:hypothetical protein BY996DRAFT_6506938 [Phakopsora pachyrhizi]